MILEKQGRLVMANTSADKQLSFEDLVGDAFFFNKAGVTELRTQSLLIEEEEEEEEEDADTQD